MIMGAKQVIDLKEYQPKRLDRRAIAESVGSTIYDRFGEKIEVEFPSPKTDNEWQLTSKGWVGYVPISPEFAIRLSPKVPVSNVFRMLELAYGLDGLKFLHNLMDCGSLEEFYTELANVLAQRILDRAKKGFYRAYIPEEERLAMLKGRLDIVQRVRRPWTVDFDCRYEEHTSDVMENQILVWGLRCILASGACAERALSNVRHAYRTIRSFAELRPCSPRECVNLRYTRLNDEYEPLHALCRFFIEHAGPTHRGGDRESVPFVIDMAALFERFVAMWLRDHLPQGLRLSIQEELRIGVGGGLSAKIDLMIERDDGVPIWILDTKYKAPDGGPAPDDLYQVVAYAEGKACKNAALVYPVQLSKPFRDAWGKGDISVQTATFSLDDDLDAAGHKLLDELGLSGAASPRGAEVEGSR